MKLRSLLVASLFVCSSLLLPLAASESFASQPKSSKSASASSKKQTASKAKSKKIETASKRRLRQQYARAIPQNYEDKFAAVVVDADTGQVLYEKNGDKPRYPASLTKMMTLYLTFDALKKGKLRMGQMLDVSERAAEQPQTNISLTPGDRISVDDCVKSLVVRSANDAAVVLAEALGGTQWNFALLMTQKARELGMRGTVFKNPNGLPDTSQYTSAYDMARIGIALRRDFPEYFPLFKTLRFDYAGVTYTTHNRVMLRYDGADGIKTGYTRMSGFNLVTSVSKNGHNLIAVIMGGKSATERDDQMIAMLDRSFAQLESHSNVASNQRTEIMPTQITNLYVQNSPRAN